MTKRRVIVYPPSKMLYMKSCRLLIYCGIILVIIATIQHDAEGFKIQKKKKKQGSFGKFLDMGSRRTGKGTLQTNKDKHRSKRLKPKAKSHSDKPIVMQPINTGNKPVVNLNPPGKPGKLSQVPIMLKPVAAKQPKKPEKKDKDKPVSDFSHKNFRCANQRIEMNCLSCKSKPYRKCPVVGASLITELKIDDEYPSSQGRCYRGRHQNFGIIDDTNIWVDKGCRARFSVCYNRVIKEPKTISCMCDYDPNRHTMHRCPNGLVGSNIVVKVALLWSFGKGKCSEYRTWGFDDRRIWVEDGCSATFKVFWT